MTEHYVTLAGQSYQYRMGQNGVPIVYTPSANKWTVERVDVRTYRFTRIVRGKLDSYLQSLPGPVAPEPKMPLAGKMRKATISNRVTQ